MKPIQTKTLALLILLVGSACRVSAEGDTGVTGEALIQRQCVGCHIPDGETLSRISFQRKTPEGWEMTIRRMQTMHGLQIRAPEGLTEGEVVHRIVKHLADTQGLAPSETQGYRYVLEQDLNQVEDLDQQLREMCGRCHSGARVALQRRPAKEWNYLMDFHLGQYPALEYSLFGRDRDWLGIARNEIVPRLAREFPLDAAAWSDWQTREPANLTGRWVLTGHLPGKGYFSAVMNATAEQPDYYSLTIDGSYGDGESFSGRGNAVVYSGHEWRGEIDFGDLTLRQVLTTSADGSRLDGRFYQSGQYAIGSRVAAIPAAGTTQLLDLFPPRIRAGDTATVTLTGSQLQGRPDFGAGVTVEEVLESTPNRIVARISADSDAATGYRTAVVGPASAPEALAVYSAVDALDIEPAYATARIGGNGGATPKVQAAFKARGIDYGDDGIPGTEDDLSLGFLENVHWTAVPRDEVAAQDEDVKFAGELDSATGIFHPADAGPNPDRYRSTNNAGNLNVVASLPGAEQGEAQADDSITATARLLVTVQRWNNPPIK